MNLFGVLDINSSALTAERERAEVVASNLANAETTSTPGGGAYKKQLVVFGTEPPGQGKFALTMSRFGDLHARGVEVEKVVQDPSPAVRRYEPGHPAADAEGFVQTPNVNPLGEMMDMREAQRAYEANLNVIDAAKSILSQTFQLLHG